jgi:hypothetical protein
MPGNMVAGPLTSSAGQTCLVTECGTSFISSDICILNGAIKYGAWLRGGSSGQFGAQSNLDNKQQLFIGNLYGLTVWSSDATINNCNSHLNSIAHGASRNGTIIGGDNVNQYQVSAHENTWDAQATQRAFIKIQKWAGVYANTSPASGVVGNDQSYIVVS